MSFLPSLPTFASLAASPYLHPPQPHPDPPKLHIAVTPLQPSTFAGEVFQAQISFKLAKTQPPPASSPSPSTPQTPRQPISVSASHADPPFSPERNSRDPISATPGRTFVPSHRVVQSLSSRGMDGTRGPIPQTAGPVMEAARRRSEFQGQPFLQGGHTPPLGYSSAMQLEKPGSEDIPPRRGQIGKQPRPKLAVLKQSATADSHSRQRSISGTELPSLRERKEPVLPDEPDAIGGSAKGRPTAPTPVRSHSISGIPTSETHSPLRGEMAVNGRNGAHIADSPVRTPTRAPASVLSSLPARDTPPSIPVSHPHARKPSYMPPSTFASSSSSSSSPGPSPRFESSPRLSGSASTRSGSISPSHPPSGLNPISESPLFHRTSRENGHRGRSDGDDSLVQEVEFPMSEEAEFSETTVASSFSSRPPPRTANSLGLGPPPSSHQTTPPHPPNPSDLPSSQGLTITWSYVHLVSTLTPSPQYLPPESLLPLRHTLLQSSVIGTGSFPSPPTPQSQGWFSLPPPPRHARAPSLTSSLFGLARGVVWGRGESSLEVERRRKWEESVREVPVMETLKSVMGVGVELGGKDGVDTLDFVYTLDLPANLPPTFQGKALKISYTLVIGVEVEYPLAPFREGIDDPWAPRVRERKSKVLKIPVRVWGGVEGAIAKQGYDLMHPIIHRKEEALLEQLEPELAKKLEELQGLEREGEHDRTPLPSTSSSFDSYALHLLSTLPPPVTPTLPPLPESSSSPTTPTAPSKKTHKHTRSQALSPLSHSVLLPEVVVQGPESAGLKSGRRSSLAARLVSGSRSPALGGGGWGGALGIDEDGEGSEEILEGLLRGSQKASYDIEKDSQTVAVLTLPKTAYRLGETILGTLTFNSPSSTRRVLKVSALLQTHEIIPSTLSLPTAPQTSKPLKRTHADHHASLTAHTTRLPFALDVPAGQGTPVSFVLRAGGGENGEEEGKGGVEWKIRLAFLVSVPPRKSTAFASGREQGEVGEEAAPTHLVPVGPVEGLDPRHVGWMPSGGIAPVLREEGTRGEKGAGGEWKEMKTEVVECDVPIVVYPPSRLGLGVEGAEGVGTGGELVM